MRQVTFTIEFDSATGEATIRLPEGRTKASDAQVVARLTEQLAEALGTIAERHIGDHDHVVGVSHHSHVHMGSK